VTNAKLAGPVVHSVSAGAGITVDNTDPANPIVSAIGGGTGTVVSVNNVDPDGSGNVELTPGDIGAADASHTHSAATTTDPGFMSASDKTKLDSIASGATANSPDATLLNRANHTGTQEISTVNGLQTALDGKASAVHTHASTTSPTSKQPWMARLIHHTRIQPQTFLIRLLPDAPC
jgi:hypothetical protein